MKDPENGDLTPLHLAAMKANLAAARALLQRNPDCINALTGTGFSPAHFAALTSEDLYQFLKGQGADLQIKTKSGLTCEDLRQFCGRVPFVSSQGSLFYQADAAQHPILLSANPVIKAKVFGKDFFHTDVPIFDPSFFPEVIEFRSPSPGPFIEAFNSFLLKRPQLIICPSILPGQLELRAKERIEAGCVITEYSGKKVEIPYFKKFADNFSKEEIENSSYRGFNDIDAKIVGNESRFANCGFPNAMIQSVVINGIERTLFFALKTIEPDDEILIDYGINMLYLIFGTQSLLNKDQMVKLYKTYGDNILDHVELAEQKIQALEKEREPTIQELVDFTAKQIWFSFPFFNPTALLYLHFNKHVDYVKLTKSVEKSTLKTVEGLASNVNYQHILNIVRILTKLKNNKRVNWGKVALWVKERLERIPLAHILKGIDLFARGKNETDVNAVLKNYDWLKDEEHPFSYKRRLENLFEIYSQHPKTKIISDLQATLNEEDREFESYQMTVELIKRLKVGK